MPYLGHSHSRLYFFSGPRLAKATAKNASVGLRVSSVIFIHIFRFLWNNGLVDIMHFASLIIHYPLSICLNAIFMHWNTIRTQIPFAIMDWGHYAGQVLLRQRAVKVKYLPIHLSAGPIPFVIKGNLLVVIH